MNSTQRNLAILKERLSDPGADLLCSWLFEPDSVFSTAADQLLQAANENGYRDRVKSHWLCELLWNAADFLSGAQVGELVSVTIEEMCRKASMPPFAAKVIARCASKLIVDSSPASPEQIAKFLRVLVVLICPDANNCEYGCKAIDFLLAPGIEATLRDFATIEPSRV